MFRNTLRELMEFSHGKAETSLFFFPDHNKSTVVVSSLEPEHNGLVVAKPKRRNCTWAMRHEKLFFL